MKNTLAARNKVVLAILGFSCFFYLGGVIYKSTYYVDHGRLNDYAINSDLKVIKEVLNRSRESDVLLLNKQYVVGVSIFSKEFKGVPVDPWGNSYYVKKTNAGFKIYTYGKDNKRGGEGEDKDVWVSIENK